MSSADDPQLEVLLACFESHSRAAKVHHPLSKQIKAEGAEILDEAVLTVTPKGKARVYDPRRVVIGTLTPALTWGVFTLLGGGKGWTLVIWVVIGAVCGGLYAYYYEHLANKNELARLGKQLLPDSSAILAYVAGAAAGKLAAVAAKWVPSAASVATIGTDLTATVLGGRPVSPAAVALIATSRAAS